MASLSRKPKSTALLLAITAALAGSAAAQDPGDTQLPTPSAGVLPLSYVGSNGRLAMSVDQDGRIGGELLGVFRHDGKRAFLTQGWLSAGGAGGMQFDYHWLPGAQGAGSATSIMKVFGAVDQNSDQDRKATLGAGFERASLALDLYYSHAMTDERRTSQDRSSFTETVSRTIDGRLFRQDVTTHTLTEVFAHPYEHGIGLRMSRFFEPGLWRLRAGLDYERGEALLEDGSAEQLNVMAGVEKYFDGTGHSVALEIEHFRKNGPFDRAAFGGERDGVRASVFWRYEFGRSFRPAKSYRTVAVKRDVKLEAPAATVVRNEAQLSAEALFEFDSAALREAAADELRPLLDRLKHVRVGPVEIVGHTCDLGSDAYNQALSERRAAAVRDWLVARGVDPASLTARGEGERHPRHANDTERDRARNRRIEVSFTSFEETVVASEPASGSITEWVREEVPQPPAWIERALRTPAFHKRAVDTYRIRRVTQTRTEGPLVPVNEAPSAADDAAQTTRDSPIIIDVLANDSDGDGNALTISAVTDPARGSASITAEGRIVYTPDADFVGTDTFIYTVQDGNGGAASAAVTVTVTPPVDINDPPIAVDDSTTTDSDVSVSIDVLENDSDPDGDALTVVAVSQAPNGTVTIDGGGSGVVYVPNDGFVGADSFTYTVADPDGLSATASVNVTVQAPNQSPIARDDDIEAFDPSVTIAVLVNDSDPDGDALFVISTTAPSYGTVVGNPDGTLTYTRTGGDDGSDSFTYTVSDGRGGTSTATVTLTLLTP